MSKFKGTITAIVTPFDASGQNLDLDSLNSFIDWQISSGVDGIVCCGSTGEGQVLSELEFQTVVKTSVARAKGKVPVIAGVGTNSTDKAVQISTELKELGVDGLLVVAPPYNKPPQRGIIEHFRSIKKGSGLPIVAYNIPGRSAVNILPETLVTLANEGTIESVKESSGALDQAIDIMAGNKSVSILSGEDSLTVSMMAMGARGVICTCSNLVPSYMSRVTTLALKADFEGAKNALYEILPVIRTLFLETNPIPLKTALAEAKLIKNPTVRLPLMEPTEATKTAIKDIVKKYVSL